MFTPEEIQQRLPQITKTLGGHDVRNLSLTPIKNNKLLIIGELKPSGLDESHWSTKDAIWLIINEVYAEWSGGSESFDLQLISQEEYLDKLAEKITHITHTIGGYPVRFLHLAYDHMDPNRSHFIRGDYYREEISDWVTNEVWYLNGEHIVEPTDYHLNMK